jgi:hypothetical protein
MSSDYADKLRGIIDAFDYELCEECGTDLHRHRLAPDILGNPHAYCPENAHAAIAEVQRWDIYDIADQLDDMPYEILQACDDIRLLPEISAIIEALAARAWLASKRGGTVGPYPEYQNTP